MPRRRCCVALVCPPRLARGVDDLRRALDDPRVDVLGPHVTLVPPVNLAADAVERAAAVVRHAAAAARPFDLVLGPVASFAPATPTVHLSVGGDDAALDALGALRGHLRDEPLDRPDEREFVPHVTLRRSAGAPVVDGAVAALVGRLGPWTVDRVHLLEHRPTPDGPPRWVTLEEVPFGGPVVRGRGGVALAVRTVRAVEPSVAELCGRPELAEGIVGQDPGRRLVVVAEDVTVPGPAGALAGPVVGAALGSVDGATARLDGVVVDQDRRRAGIGRQVLGEWCSVAAARGAEVVVVPLDVAGCGGGGDGGGAGQAALAWRALVAGSGFAALGDLGVRRL